MLRQCEWSTVSIERFGEFLGWLRTGLPPDVAPVVEMPRRLSDATIAIRLQAVRSFYRFHQLRGLDVAPGLFGWGANRSPFRPFLDHVSRRDAVLRPTVSVRRRREKPPTLTPRQINAIKDACAQRDSDNRYVGSVRDRLFFTLLEETGLRIAEETSELRTALAAAHGELLTLKRRHGIE